ncbi:MAG: hypothetical protein M3Y56_08240 [Armatimonadota bacterium]|nr:hypothetical protein [Armatimonadota bacterium]
MIYKTTWTWYVSYYTFWFLDWVEFHKDCDSAREKPTSLEDVIHGRFNIPVVNEDTAEQFLTAMEPYRVTLEELRTIVVDDVAHDDVEDTDCFPAVLVDFDQRRLISNHPETMSHEIYAPAGWEVQKKRIVNEVPLEYRYWVIDGKDVFAELWGKSKLQAEQA